jgi:nucleoside-diphosphate-sugar epimerase
MRIFVAGAGGAIGARLIPQLVARGHQVVATTRSAAKTAHLRSLGAEVAVVDGLDAVKVGEAVANAEPDAIVHQMTALSGKPDLRHFDRWFARTNALRTTGTHNLLAAANAAGVRRFVAQSFTGWTNVRTGGPVKTETDPFDPTPAKNQVETLRAIQTLETAVVSAPLGGIVLRYANFYGPGASESLVDLVKRRQFPIVGGGNGVWSWLHIDDAAAATVLAVEDDACGIYNIADDEPAKVNVWLPYLAECVGAKAPLRVPKWLGRLAAGDVAVQWMTEGRGASNEKAKRELSWRPRWRSWRDGFRDGLSDAGTSADAPAAAAAR